MFVSTRTLAASMASLLVSSVSGFGVVVPITTTTTTTTSIRKSLTTTTIPLFGIRRRRHCCCCENKYYQLEEMEDAENCTTELFLKADGEVIVGQTDGPPYIAATGQWNVGKGNGGDMNNGDDDDNDDDLFRMVITRTYRAGTKGRDMGEFEYSVPRTFLGQMTLVGESVAVTGVLYPVDDADFDADRESATGYFNMIDSTDARADPRSDARVSASS